MQNIIFGHILSVVYNYHKLGVIFYLIIMTKFFYTSS